MGTRRLNRTYRRAIKKTRQLKSKRANILIWTVCSFRVWNSCFWISSQISQLKWKEAYDLTQPWSWIFICVIVSQNLKNDYPHNTQINISVSQADHPTRPNLFPHPYSATSPAPAFPFPTLRRFSYLHFPNLTRYCPHLMTSRRPVRIFCAISTPEAAIVSSWPVDVCCCSRKITSTAIAVNLIIKAFKAWVCCTFHGRPF